MNALNWRWLNASVTQSSNYNDLVDGNWLKWWLARIALLACSSPIYRHVCVCTRNHPRYSSYLPFQREAITIIITVKSNFIRFCQILWIKICTQTIFFSNFILSSLLLRTILFIIRWCSHVKCSVVGHGGKHKSMPSLNSQTRNDLNSAVSSLLGTNNRDRCSRKWIQFHKFSDSCTFVARPKHSVVTAFLSPRKFESNWLENEIVTLLYTCASASFAINWVYCTPPQTPTIFLQFPSNANVCTLTWTRCAPRCPPGRVVVLTCHLFVSCPAV